MAQTVEDHARRGFDLFGEFDGKAVTVLLRDAQVVLVDDRQTEFLDHTIYHLDGANAFHHLDALLELPQLQAIQVLPGAGNPGPLHYIDVLRKVQAAERNLHITIPASEVEEALSLLSERTGARVLV